MKWQKCCRTNLVDCPYLYVETYLFVKKGDKAEDEPRNAKENKCMSIPCSYLLEQKIDQLNNNFTDKGEDSEADRGNKRLVLFIIRFNSG